MNILNNSRTMLLAGASGLALLAMPAFATDAVVAADAPQIANSDDIIVTATNVNQATPITASIHTFEPQAIVSRSIIENSIAPTADYSQVLMLTPGASLVPATGNGIGLGDVKINLRGFTDGQYNITYDGIPFNDSNDPTHHSTSYFPNGTYDRIIVDRGPGSATDQGQASYGGNVHIISREASDKFFLEGQAVYGSFNTMLGRLTVNSGSLESLGGLKIIAVGEYKKTDGALSNQPGWWGNGFVKIEKPLGSNAQFTLLGNYNQSLFNASDASGASGGSTLAQQAIYGKQFGATTAANPGLYANAQSDWNWENKTTDMEIARLQWHVSSNLTIDNKLYTYFYKNFTLSSEDSATQCGLPVGGVVNTCSNSANMAVQTFNTPGTKAGGGYLSGSIGSNDIAGYTKVNQYRNWGDILQVDLKTSIGTAKAGTWYEHSTSHRYRYDYDFTQGALNGGIGNYTFNFNIMNDGQNWNYKEVDKSSNLMLNNSPVPAYINYDEHTSWDQIEGFGEFEFKLMNDTLTITPGIKVMDFTRKIDTPIATQKVRVGLVTQESYKPALPYFTVNGLIQPNLSVYAQFAKGFIVPTLGTSFELKGNSNPNVPFAGVPTKTTNYQAGMVYAGNRLNIDADVYYIEASNSSSVDPANPGNIKTNLDAALYMGVEGQVSYVVIPGLTAIANATIMQSKDQATHNWLAMAPNYTALLGAVYSHGRYKLSYLHKFTGFQWVDGGSSANTTGLHPYSYGVISGSVTFGQITAGLTVNNPLNSRPVVGETFGATGASTNLYYYQTPASYQASLKIRF